MIDIINKSTVDLHLHTIASDGLLSPSELVEQALKKGKSAIAITDHDTTTGICSALNQTKGRNIEVIPGIEFSVQYAPYMHILGLYIDIKNSHLIKELNRLKKIRCALIAQAFFKVRQFGINISPQQLKSEVGTVTIFNLKKYLLSKNLMHIECSLNAELQNLLNKWEKVVLSPQDCISLIHQCQGIAILAHPLLLGYTMDKLDSILYELKKLGLDGIEVDHPAQPAEVCRELEKMLYKYSLIRSGGSDYHGNNYTSDNTQEVSYDTLKEIKSLRKERYNV